MTHVIAVGHAQGLCALPLRRPPHLDGRRSALPHAGGRLRRRSTPAAPPRIVAGVMSWHWGPTVAWSDDLGATWNETETRARSRSPRTPAPPSAGCGRSSPTPPTGRASCGPAASRRRCGAATTAARPSPSYAGSGTIRTARSGRPGSAARPCTRVLPDPTSDRVTVAMSTGGVYVSDDGATDWTPRNNGIHVKFMPDPYPEFGQCVHKVAVDAAGPSACTRRTTTASTAPTTVG